MPMQPIDYGHRRRHALICLLLWLISASAGCQRLTTLAPIGQVPGLSPWDAQTYGEYVAENMTELNRRYTERYEPVEFVVDTAVGSARVQSLIDTAATALLAEAIQARGSIRTTVPTVTGLPQFAVTKARSISSLRLSVSVQ